MRCTGRPESGPVPDWTIETVSMTRDQAQVIPIEEQPIGPQSSDTHIEFKPLSMMALRGSPGEVLDEVSKEGAAYVIERNGQQKACLVPISCFLPDIQRSRVTSELDRLQDSVERFRVAISAEREMQFLFHEFSGDTRVEVTVTLPHGYPNKAPVVTAEPIEQGCPHRWPNGALCLYGAMAVWNPGRHDVMHAVALFRRWIQHYTVWRQTTEWPQEAWNDD